MALDPHGLLGLEPRIDRHVYTRRDTAIYALGIGAGRAPGEDLDFLLEDRLAALPTMAAIFAGSNAWLREPRYGIDARGVLHAEEAIEFHAPLPPEGEIEARMTVDAIVDKGREKGCLLLATSRLHDAADATLLATSRRTVFLRFDGGQGGGGVALARPYAMPERAADFLVAMPTRPEQALLYCLSGDLNPIHIDPEAAREAGLERPILHGLCTYGFAGRAILRMLCGDRPERLRALNCRFTAMVMPGETLEVAIWRVRDGEAAFRVTVAERQVVVVNNGFAAYDG